MKLIKKFNSYYNLMFFTIFLLIFVVVNYFGGKVLSLDDFFYEKVVKTFNLVCFLPGTLLFFVISINNFMKNKKINNIKEIRISLIPISLIGLLYVYIFLMLFYTVFIRDVSVN
ncbi:hypothetical protein [Chryseobacterium vrystaatense]|uniref:Branched-chain amino acid:cation transporter, LIVCS family n=1 Tax=Chryseobacterium vrystaatense TaxID=307480 RepID=A0A1M5N6X3_9FLAO|nr:hypothetical protein [Chryseobacterium vrystaatense]SHG85346.1 hypothetical protein SAMN02787073_4961 [Chryseobacterium vrystaatense]